MQYLRSLLFLIPVLLLTIVISALNPGINIITGHNNINRTYRYNNDLMCVINKLQNQKKALIFIGLTDTGQIISEKQLTTFEQYLKTKNKKQLFTGIVLLGLLLSIILVLLRIISLMNIAKKKQINNENRLDLAMEVANFGLWDIDLIKKDVFLSKHIAQLLAYNNAEILNIKPDKWKDYFHPDDVPLLTDDFQLHSKGEIPSLMKEIRINTFEGIYKWYSINGRIIEYKKGKPARMVGVLMDINSRKEFEEELRIAKEKAEENDLLKSAFLANMSHEIRTPMNAIIGFTDLIISKSISGEESGKYLKLIRNSGESLLNLINDIIDLSKIQSGRLSLRPEKFDLNNLIDNIVVIASSSINKYNKKIKLITHKGSTDETFNIIADPFRLEQIINNLVNNAIKFTNSGEITISYVIEGPNTLTFAVKDTGIGIAPEHQEMIFERFRQVKTSSTDNPGGTGLGLAITKSLISLMGGEISLDSAVDKGSTFTFTINYKQLQPGLE